MRPTLFLLFWNPGPHLRPSLVEEINGSWTFWHFFFFFLLVFSFGIRERPQRREDKIEQNCHQRKETTAELEEEREEVKTWGGDKPQQKEMAVDAGTLLSCWLLLSLCMKCKFVWIYKIKENKKTTKKQNSVYVYNLFYLFFCIIFSAGCFCLCGKNKEHISLTL